MAAPKSDPAPRDAKPEQPATTGLVRVMYELDELIADFETVLLSSHLDAPKTRLPVDETCIWDEIRQQARRLAIAELSAKYTRKSIRSSLCAAESLGKAIEERLRSRPAEPLDPRETGLGSIYNGYFRLYSTELFDALGQPTDIRLGTLRLHATDPTDSATPIRTAVELALNTSFYVADSTETLPYHNFNVPDLPSLRNRGIPCRKPEDDGAFPEYDSWLLFTFLGNGCIKIEIPIEMCADIYGGPILGRENEEVLFWGILVEDGSI
ncbi:hypothetical protein EJ04DRAFT_532783 [Polyplosphaeria fusca]|uniref:Uncharacterized protein n=1 Tax=Polyplosphaeria fusca TaxID=682080 RepID=A0A9P4V5U7_9PLEO|nr:hypothetical protein EJ04DRAFT_532783 [Polyplosphaeria fusca]